MRVFEFKPIENTEAVATAYLHALVTEMNGHKTHYPVVVVCPGGGYQMCSQRESEPVAMEYFAKGYNVFVLNYSLHENAHEYRPLKELAETIKLIRTNKDEWNCAEDKIAVCGFSAGGHLCGSMATLWNNPVIFSSDKKENEKHRPNLAILGYPAVYFGDEVEITEETIKTSDFISVKGKVTPENVPCFIWQTVTDPIVKADTVLAFASELQNNNVLFEAHFFPCGGHGLATCNKETGIIDSHNYQWINLSVNFLNKMFDIE